MEGKDYGLNDIVRMRKKHPCGGERWKITRLGADIKLKCLSCGRIVMLPRNEFEKSLAAVLRDERE